MVRLLISAAEGSGDAHAANLVREVRRRRPDVEFAGFGGQLLAAAGCHLDEDLVSYASMGLGFLAHLRHYLRVIRTFDRRLREPRPAAVILVDSPGLHFIFARLARWAGVPVVYYICPQIWAWAPWRRSKVIKYTDLLLAILPFEEGLYRNPRVPVTCVGHPLGDSLALVPPDAGRDIRSSLRIPAAAQVIGILPGSRSHEVEELMPTLRGIVDLMDLDPRRHRLLISSFSESFRGTIEDALLGCRIPHEVLAADPRAIILASDFVLVKSGTVTLEAAYFEKPMIVLYGSNPFRRFLSSLFLVPPYFALPNILGASLFDGEPTVLERLCRKREAVELAPMARALLDPGPARDGARERLRRLKESTFAPGAAARAADALLGFLGRSGA